jgi:hypothetical protein
MSSGPHFFVQLRALVIWWREPSCHEDSKALSTTKNGLHFFVQLRALVTWWREPCCHEDSKALNTKI